MSSVSSPVSMMTPESESGSIASSSPRLETQDCRIAIRRLLSKYGRQEIEKLLLEESCEPSSYGHSSSTISFNGSFIGMDQDMTTAPSHNINFPTVPSSNRPRALSALASGPGPLSSTGPTSAAGGARSNGRLSSSYRMDYACGFCAEIGITKTCTRRNDLRRHIDQFHNTNAQWLCQHPGCRMAFDWQTAYQIHLRNEHGGSQMRMDEAKVVLCPQTVFACGYEGCHHVLEAANDTGASATWKAYTAHLIKHCEEGRGSGGWDYSHRMRNLLRQSRVAAAWKSTGAEAGPGPLRWDPSTSRTLRKLLETRHLDNLSRLLGLASLLASTDPDAAKQLQGKLDLHLPIKKLCPAAAIKHEMRNASVHANDSLACQGLGINESDLYKMPGTEITPYHGVEGSPRSHPMSGIPFRTAAAPDAFNHEEEDEDHRSSSGNQIHSSVPPQTPPQAFYGMMAPAIYPPQYIAFRHPADSSRPHDACAPPPAHPVAPETGVVMSTEVAAIPRGHHPEGWAEVYGSSGLQSPPLTDTYYDMGSPLVPGHQSMLAAYGQAPPS
ncbi:hypothetical protein HIM_07307 [Hirsutella minnesotensis 3608]|uniref:C2H2-type domain-containing protein n=1 Tax=Hirsutella minnesotensis 3608 TaxID=1043627 RepID=A0A0F7ZTL1_9HYPO|nr:hypothetical protein HIM_07307 [Hirsutella minnesotensis 3608]